jgi:hypothetical protein
LLSASGDWLALRKSYLNGSLVVISTAGPLTNDALRNQDNARWVLRELLGPVQQGAVVAFDEAHYTEQPQTDEEPSFETLVLDSAVGRALLFGVLVLFVYLVLAGRRLGPPLPAAESGRAARTMYEHVQALASLYRRARQFLYLRDHFERHYRRLVARSLGVEAAAAEPGRLAEELRLRGLTEEQAEQLATALDEVSRARRDRDLLEAVTHAEQAATALPHSTQERRLAASTTR